MWNGGNKYQLKWGRNRERETITKKEENETNRLKVMNVVTSVVHLDCNKRDYTYVFIQGWRDVHAKIVLEFCMS